LLKYFARAYVIKVDIFTELLDGPNVTPASVESAIVDTVRHSGSTSTARGSLESIKNYFVLLAIEPQPQKQRLTFGTPQVERYGKELISLLRELLRHHLAKTFPLLLVSLESEHTTKFGDVYHLALATVGGVFCNLPRQFRAGECHVQWFPSNTRSRSTTSKGCLCFLQEKAGPIRTFPLHKIYGLCSGGRRSFELAEAF
jgi:hypothetical protein